MRCCLVQYTYVLLRMFQPITCGCKQYPEHSDALVCTSYSPDFRSAGASGVKHYCSEAQPNNAFQPTPLRGPKIVCILQSDFVLKAIPIYPCGAAECWPISRAQLRAVPNGYWDRRTVAETMIPSANIDSIAATMPVYQLLPRLQI